MLGRARGHGVFVICVRIGMEQRDREGLGAAESLAAWANATPGVSAKQAAATLMNFAWAGLGDLMEGRPWSSPVRRG